MLQSFITKENWSEQDAVEEQMLYGYAVGTQFMLPHLERISKIEDFDQMKQELLNFITERDEFVTFAYKNTLPFNKNPT